MDIVGRRRFLVCTSGLLAAPQRVFAQAAPKVHRILWLSAVDRTAGQYFLTPFLEGMAALGYVQGKNLEVDARWGDNSRERLDGLAVDAAALKPAVIVTQGPALRSARKIPGTTPVAFSTSGDPIVLGAAKSLARPGAHFTGVTLLAFELSGKRVEMLHEIVPKTKRIAVLSNPNHGGDAKEFETTRETAVRLGLEVSHHTATDGSELDRALAGVAASQAGAVLIHPDGLFVQQRAALARFGIERRLPTVSGWASVAEAGILLTYGPVLSETYRRLAYFVDRILRGTNPAELPIEQPTKLELVVNLRTAKAIGARIPQSILVRADRVIE